MSYCYLSTSLCRMSYLEEAIIECGNLSNKYVELSAPHPYQSLIEISKILKKYKEKGYKFTLHNYFPPPKKSFVLNIASDEEKIIYACNMLIDQALKLSLDAGSSIYGLHAGYLSKANAKEDGMFEFENKEITYSKALNKASKFISNVVENFNKKNVNFLVENLFPSVARNSSLNCDMQQIDDLMNSLPKKVGLLLDLGHMNISSRLMGFDRKKFLDEYLTKYGDRLLEVHISENNGLKDEHRALEEGSWQYDALKMIKQVKTLKQERVYCLESRNAKKDEIKTNLENINKILN